MKKKQNQNQNPHQIGNPASFTHDPTPFTRIPTPATPYPIPASYPSQTVGILSEFIVLTFYLC